MHGIGRCPIFGGGTGDSVVEYSHIDDFYGSSAVHSEILSVWQGSIGDWTLRYNLFTDAESTGGLMWGVNSTPSAALFVYGNVFYKPNSSRYIDNIFNGVIGGWSSQQFNHVRLYNNTFINIDRTILGSIYASRTDTVAQNNLFYTTNSPNFAAWTTHDYNHFIAAGGTHGEANGTSASSGDPFSDYPNLDFSLTNETTAGLTLGPPYNVDMFGNVRGADGVWDRGAYEYVHSGVNQPLVGDINNDGTVNALDWSIMNTAWFTSDPTSDINSDTLVNSLDFGLMNANWGLSS
jgi:hypothetical protein